MNDPNPKDRIPPGSDKVIERMRRHLIGAQPRGEKFSEIEPRDGHHNSQGQFISPHGWWFEWGFDDSVIEINTIPADVEVYEKYKDDMQDAIFATAANEGFYPALFLGGGHINLGMSAFEGNNLLLRNFVVDHLFNHNELFLGVLSYDSHNAGSIFIQTADIRRKVRQIIEAFDNDEFEDGRAGQIEFLREIHNVMNSDTDRCFVKWGTPGMRQCYFGLNFLHHDRRDGEARIEFRGVRAQASMQVWVNQIRLIKKRLLYLERFNRPIPIQPAVQVMPLNFNLKVNHLLNPPVDPQQALRSYYRYVSESGERWQDHREYLWPKWGWDGDIEKFENSEWFKDRESKRAAPRQSTKDCEKHLTR
jgi:hypothetical protein